MKSKTIIITVVVALIVGAAAFFGGMQYQKMQRPNLGDRQFAMDGSNSQMSQGRGNFQGARPVSGEVISQDDNSVTVKIQDGSSKIVILSDQTTINKASEGTKSDLKTGERVVAFGTENSDGSITAQNISIGSNMMSREGPGGNPEPTQAN